MVCEGPMKHGVGESRAPSVYSCMHPCGSMQPVVASVAVVVPEVQILASAISVITVPE